MSLFKQYKKTIKEIEKDDSLSDCDRDKEILIINTLMRFLRRNDSERYSEDIVQFFTEGELDVNCMSLFSYLNMQIGALHGHIEELNRMMRCIGSDQVKKSINNIISKDDGQLEH